MKDTVNAFEQLRLLVIHHLDVIYGTAGNVIDRERLADELLEIMRFDDTVMQPVPHQNHWDQSDIAMITYGDSIKNGDEVPLKTLHSFLDNHCDEVINSVHILPFFPYSSDDGFAVINFLAVNESLGDWSDISSIASEYRLMADLVINHCSSRSQWFENFKNNVEPGKGYFIVVDKDVDTSAVVRPRTDPLLRETRTIEGDVYVWCTFSHDQIDLNFANPEVLKEFVNIIRHYLDNGVGIFRLDAVAFLWKQLGTPCINLDETHEIIRLLRTLVEHAAPDTVIITETNLPNRENITYFGNANEAHCIYNFSLPPLLINTLITGSCKHLKTWMMSMPPAQNGTTFFNFIASHDGVGLRPAEGLLSDEELDDLINTMQNFGGRVSWRHAEGGISKPYEINITLYDALQGSVHGPDKWGKDRFICAHAVMLSLEGIPAFYIHSLLATGNDYQRVEHTNNNRAINRHQWELSELEDLLSDKLSHHHQVFNRLKEIIKIRKQQSAFHPNATQFTLQLGESMFGFWRQSIDRRQSIFCIYNIGLEEQELVFSDLNLIATDLWKDLISDMVIDQDVTKMTLSPYQFVWITNRW